MVLRKVPWTKYEDLQESALFGASLIYGKKFDNSTNFTHSTNFIHSTNSANSTVSRPRNETTKASMTEACSEIRCQITVINSWLDYTVKFEAKARDTVEIVETLWSSVPVHLPRCFSRSTCTCTSIAPLDRRGFPRRRYDVHYYLSDASTLSYP